MTYLITIAAVMPDWIAVLWVLGFLGSIFLLVFLVADAMGRMRAETRHIRYETEERIQQMRRNTDEHIARMRRSTDQHIERMRGRR